MADSRKMRQIIRLIEQVPASHANGSLPGETEVRIANLYREISEDRLASDWYIRAAAEAEKKERALRAVAILRAARKNLPNDLGIVRELSRLCERWSIPSES